MGEGTGIGRVRGLGSARHGAKFWLMQRFTAIGNLVLVTYLLASFATLPMGDYTAVREWASSAIPATALILLIVSVFWHARLGMQVMLEDYLHDHGNKFAALAALNLAAVGGAAFGIINVLRLALGGA